jgi:hypothetical protein
VKVGSFGLWKAPGSTSMAAAAIRQAAAAQAAEAETASALKALRRSLVGKGVAGVYPVVSGQPDICHRRSGSDLAHRAGANTAHLWAQTDGCVCACRDAGGCLDPSPPPASPPGWPAYWVAATSSSWTVHTSSSS